MAAGPLPMGLNSLWWRLAVSAVICLGPPQIHQTEVPLTALTFPLAPPASAPALSELSTSYCHPLSAHHASSLGPGQLGPQACKGPLSADPAGGFISSIHILITPTGKLPWCHIFYLVFSEHPVSTAENPSTTLSFGFHAAVFFTGWKPLD